MCPPPSCCCGSVRWSFECGSPASPSNPFGCETVNPGDPCPPPCDDSDPPDEPVDEDAEDDGGGPVDPELPFLNEVENLPPVPNFSKLLPIVEHEENDNFIFALDSGCSIPCATEIIDVSFDGCCLYVNGCEVTTVGSGTLTWNPNPTGGCAETATVNGDSSGSLDVEDGTSVSVAVESTECCTCTLLVQSGCGTAFDKRGIYTLRNGKLYLNKRKYMQQRNNLIRHRAEKKLRKMAKERKNSLLNKIKRS